MTVDERTIADDLRNTELEARIGIAKKVGKLLRHGSQADHRAAIELARILVEDAAISVRLALAQEVKGCSFLPEKIARTIGRDINQISMPFLEVSEAVNDEFLEEIVRDCEEELQMVIAGRQGLSEFVSFAICDVGEKGAVDILMDNESADVSERAAKRVVERFPGEVSLLEKLAERSDLTVKVAQMLIFKVSQSYGEILTKKFQLADDYSSYLLSLAKMRVFSHVLDVAPLGEVLNYFEQLKAVSGLNSDVILYYLQHRHVRLFVASVSVLSKTEFHEAQNMIGYHNPNALEGLLRKSGISRQVVGALLIAYERLFRG